MHDQLNVKFRVNRVMKDVLSKIYHDSSKFATALLTSTVTCSPVFFILTGVRN